MVVVGVGVFRAGVAVVVVTGAVVVEASTDVVVVSGTVVDVDVVVSGTVVDVVDVVVVVSGTVVDVVVDVVSGLLLRRSHPRPHRQRLEPGRSPVGSPETSTMTGMQT